jgi:hypothetical protein
MSTILLQLLYGGAIAAVLLLLWFLRAARRLRTTLGLGLFLSLMVLGVFLRRQVDRDLSNPLVAEISHFGLDRGGE